MADYGESCIVSYLETVLSGRGIGSRLDVDALDKLVERTGAFLIVDRIQEAGVERPALKRWTSTPPALRSGSLFTSPTGNPGETGPL